MLPGVMRLWTVHPRYLDAKGLVAAWREALLAQKVLAGKTRGYKQHPQLHRFHSHAKPMQAVAHFLLALADEAQNRGYCFDRTKILKRRANCVIEETRGQLLYEWKHLRKKLKARSPLVYRQWQEVDDPEGHPLFRIVEGKVRDWERG
jgi:hypothetical protein